ncbi:MAG: hypothetical protein ACQETH_08300 [Candidatus Rifleibacteriota bacterium]
MNRKKQGSAFVIVIGVLGVIIFASTMFMTSTIEEGRQTTMSVKGLHAASLAEAALERAMSIISDKINEIDPAEVDADSLAVKLRLPAKIDSGVTLGLGGNLGSDELLQLPDSVTEEIILTKEELQEGDDENRLDKIVEYMTREGIEEYDVNVKVNVEKAFRIAPGSDYPDFKVPGVDIGWNMRPDVENFLNGEGYSPLQIGFPDDLSWLGFSIPISIGGFTIININVAGIIDKLMPEINIAGEPRSFKELTSIDFMAKMLINELLSGGERRYPIEIVFDKDKINIPTDPSVLWPSGITFDTSDYEQYLEKYGQIKLESEASITYKDGYTAKRRVAAVKDFKVADCEPPASMYSCFIGNFANNKISFNNYGGQFFVSNYDYSGLWNKIKEVALPGPTELTEEELASREVPGLIRVNYIDESSDGTQPLVCNVGMVGDWNAPRVTGDDSGTIVRTLGGMETALILSSRTRMALAGGKYNVNAEVSRRNTSTSSDVPSGMTGGNTGQTSTDGFSVSVKNDYKLEYAKDMSKSIETPKNYLKELVGPSRINIMPDVGRLSAHPIAVAIELALKPLVDKVVPPSVAGVTKAFQQWDMAYMGTNNWMATIPNTGVGANKTHFFGYAGFYPTLTREIEGNVLKKYRRWKMCIIGLNPMDRLVIPSVPPLVIPPPPLVIPLWYTMEVLTKYDYNLTPLKANDENDDIDLETYEYDPAKLENMPPNLYTLEQYAKKATYYYENYQAFLDDLPNRMTEVNGKKIFVLNGITYISGSVGDSANPFNPPGLDGEFNVCGKGMIVCSGNFYLGSNIKVQDRTADDLTVFTLMIRNGGLIVLDGGVQREIQGSVYTDKGLYVHADSSMHFIGNWVTNQFSKAAMSGTVAVDYVSSRVRSSLASLHPERGKFDPRRYHVSFSPLWASWRSF